MTKAQHKRKIDAVPRVKYSDLLRPCAGMDDTLEDFTRLYTRGRDGIHQICASLRPGTGQRIWMPSFHCGVEVQSAIDAGFQPDFFRIRPDMTIDLEDLEGKIRENPGPVLVVHYYGFAQPEIQKLVDFCHQHQLPVIEDCTHAFLSRRENQSLGAFGDFAVFSLYKTMGLLDGGAIRVNAEHLNQYANGNYIYPLEGHFSWHLHFEFLKRITKNLLGHKFTKIYRSIRYQSLDFDSFGSVVVQESNTIPPLIGWTRNYQRKMSWLSRRIAASHNPAEIVAARRRNYFELHKLLRKYEGYQPVFSDLTPGTCPLFLPLRVHNRSHFCDRLREDGIGTFIFGEYCHPLMDKSLFPEAQDYREQIVCLPVHHRLNGGDIQYIARMAGPLLREHEPAPSPHQDQARVFDFQQAR